MVNHGHIFVNGNRVDVPSYQVRPGDVVKVAEKPSSQQLGMRSLDLTQSIPIKDWLTIEREKLEGTVARLPEPADIDSIVDVQRVVELYSR